MMVAPSSPPANKKALLLLHNRANSGYLRCWLKLISVSPFFWLPYIDHNLTLELQLSSLILWPLSSFFIEEMKCRIPPSFSASGVDCTTHTASNQWVLDKFGCRWLHYFLSSDFKNPHVRGSLPVD